jgi:hypothetical protein
MNKKFENQIFDVSIVNLSHKYDQKSQKVCLLTVKSFETRINLYEFFLDYEVIDQKGIKQKLNIVDALYQKTLTSQKDNIVDPIDNTISECNFNF